MANFFELNAQNAYQGVFTTNIKIHTIHKYRYEIVTIQNHLTQIKCHSKIKSNPHDLQMRQMQRKGNED